MGPSSSCTCSPAHGTEQIAAEPAHPWAYRFHPETRPHQLPPFWFRALSGAVVGTLQSHALPLHRCSHRLRCHPPLARQPPRHWPLCHTWPHRPFLRPCPHCPRRRRRRHPPHPHHLRYHSQRSMRLDTFSSRQHSHVSGFHVVSCLARQAAVHLPSTDAHRYPCSLQPRPSPPQSATSAHWQVDLAHSRSRGHPLLLHHAFLAWHLAQGAHQHL